VAMKERKKVRRAIGLASVWEVIKGIEGGQ
jgi:hypothetical protein